MRLLAALLVSALSLAAAPADAEGIEVDLELVLLVDVSRSMSPRELEIQRRGYAAALDSDAVFAAVQSGALQRVAITYVEWAGSQEVVIDWRLIETRADLAGFAAELENRFDPSLRRTSISEALVFGARMIEANAYRGLRRVIDISGDGPNNQGRPVTEARDAVLAQGIAINGLPLMTRDGIGSQWHLDGLDLYYESCVIGGPGAFVIPVLDWGDFTDAVRRKLVLEMVGQPAPAKVLPAQYTPHDPQDCMVGEKMWQERRRYWDEP
ncbi:DUF1194 domain-containing protein [Rhodovulum euryhalinum]|uniref:Uncharacterized protein DUF1194 n=1 Tax=Rhodovulum euryhalinum TaxID=35805 RepID=A0A4R2KEA7_9RHOB|nr:DUF1194 domain-containing protein [Rhodovulum euryhalinum]TCO71324.1 uncharacterized protein DUF1194 [Rhodovulum euryhalinum]